MRCKRCIKGMVAKEADDKFICINCGAEHYASGDIIKPPRLKKDYAPITGPYSTGGTTILIPK